MFDILMYLFESYVLGRINLASSTDQISDKLQRAGFPSDDIEQTFHWLEQLSNYSIAEPELSEQHFNTAGIRIFSSNETTRLSVESRGFINTLESNGILNSYTRELVIDRALALDIGFIDVTEIKLIALMVLGAHIKDEKEMESLQELLLTEKKHETLH